MPTEGQSVFETLPSPCGKEKQPIRFVLAQMKLIAWAG